MIKYKNFKSEDYKSLYDFAYPIWNNCYKNIIPEGQITMLCHNYFDYDNIKSFILDGYIYKYILYNNDISGFIVYKIYDEYIYLDKLYLKEEYRGLHISSSVFKDLLKEYSRKIRLNVNQNNTLGLRSYLGNGFEIIEKKKYDLDNGYVNYDYIMEKSI